MSIFSRISLTLIFSGLIVFGSLGGCGSGTNNDQGTSFLALGYFQDATGTDGSSGTVVPLFIDTAFIPATPGGPGGAGFIVLGDGGNVVVTLGLMNRLTSQFINVRRIDCDYEVPGTNLAIPSDTFNAALFLDEATSDADGLVAGTEGFIEFEIVSPDVFAFLNVSKNSLPQLPFRMIVTCSATGVTVAGDVLVTQPVRYTIQFVDAAECCTGEGVVDGFNDGTFNTGGGFQEGPATGGTPDTFGGAGVGASPTPSPTPAGQEEE